MDVRIFPSVFLHDEFDVISNRVCSLHFQGLIHHLAKSTSRAIALIPLGHRGSGVYH